MDDLKDPGGAEPYMTIGAFARRVGLAPSALRFYDDCGMLRPTYVDDVTGYRYYTSDQEPRAVLVRRLRETGMPLTDATLVLDGGHDQARAVLSEHARRTQAAATATRSAIERILRDLCGGPRRIEVGLGGAELASAVRQVAPAVASAATQQELPVLGCVLMEVEAHEVRFVATDRYRLAVRALRPLWVDGGPGQALLDASELTQLLSWIRLMPELTVELDQQEQSTRIRSGTTTRTLPAADQTFPAYRVILDELPTTRHRIVVDRLALSEAMADADGPVSFDADEQRLTLTCGSSAARTLPASCTGTAPSTHFDPATLLPTLDASVGPDVLLEISSPIQPVVVRSADQGSFTSLVMPVPAR